MKYHPNANLRRPSSKTSGPPPLRAGSKRQAWAEAGTSQALGLVAELLLTRIESRSPISAVSTRALARWDRRVEDEVLEHLQAGRGCHP